MIRIGKLAFAALSVALLAGCAKQPATPVVDTAADDAAIRAINPAWFQAHAAGDADAVAALYAEDASVAAPGLPPARGRAAIREMIAADIASSKAAGLSFKGGSSPEFGLSGDLGWESNTLTVVDASGATVDTGKYLTVYGRRNGKWMILRDMWNSDTPTPAPPAAAAEAEMESPQGQ
jgi:ketosteroid isomerase-like protein